MQFMKKASKMDFPEDLRNFLLDTKSYAESPSGVQEIETHASVLFVTDRFVYKVKKNVDFGFLNFSSLDKRKYFLERELTLNKRLCPDIYISVIPIWKSQNRFSMESGSEIAEYALVMKRMQEGGFIKTLLRENKIEQIHINQIADKLEDFYKNAKTDSEISQNGEIIKLRYATDENFKQTEPYIGKAFSRQAHVLLNKYTEDFYEKHSDLFHRRVSEGWIRDCHGDLHLEHMHYHDGNWCIYDCIEFNNNFRWIDVLSDISFFMMDLDFNQRPDLSEHFKKRFKHFCRTEEENSLLNFYRVYRAVVRAKVACLTAKHTGEDDQNYEIASKYFQLAMRYVLTETNPTVFVFMGMIASGKSNLAARFASETGITFISCDSVRKKSAGISETERTEESKRKEIYTSEFTDKTYGKVLDFAKKTIVANKSVILDCTFSKKKYRDAIRKEFSEKGVKFSFIEAVVSEDTIRMRLLQRAEKKDVLSDARLEDYETIKSGYESPGSDESDIIRIDSSGSKDDTFQKTADAIFLK